ncbi:siderophore-interacting protein [Thalassospira marina]|uniref:NADPH-dependent ferric siderophore reductase n=1 Tax=Thalassospira marina TaxID=2048283 RepID=A0ABM6Q9F8_9PROT|nr:siderophore-interacting protein [Thalassospira marina]AUG53172.1 NADPH-dependent ferric siderophore reductase [Thalassospira marina]
MPRPAPRQFEVIRKSEVTPNMLRITLGGDGMNTFPEDQASAYVKLMFDNPGQEKPMLRTYTVRAHRENEIDIDFVMHEDGGPASRWAIDCKAGDTIAIGGPGPKKLVDNNADWVLIVGDMTALPAISVNLEQLPADARGYAVIEVLSDADIQPLLKPENVTIHWVVNPHPGTNSTALVDAVMAIEWSHGKPSVWAACEFTGMQKLRHHFRNERAIDKREMYISSYWKLGANEETHKSVKREDAEREEAA